MDRGVFANAVTGALTAMHQVEVIREEVREIPPLSEGHVVIATSAYSGWLRRLTCSNCMTLKTLILLSLSKSEKLRRGFYTGPTTISFLPVSRAKWQRR